VSSTTSDTSFFGHPRGLSTLFFTEMWERFSYYGLRPLLVLFMSAALAESGFGFERDQASAIVGIYAASVWLASLPGGWIADRWLGLRRAVSIGALLITLGHLSIGLSGFAGNGAAGKGCFFAGLVLIVFGTGLLKPNISAIVGDLYPEGGARRDAGFSIFYMGINSGSFLGQVVTGLLAQYFGWHVGFGAAGVGMLCGLLWFRFAAPLTLGDLGADIVRDPDPAKQARREGVVRTVVIGIFATIGVVFALGLSGVPLPDPVTIARSMTYVLVGTAAAFFGYVLLWGTETADERKRTVVVLVLFLAAAVFWAAFEQAPTSLNLFAKDFTDRMAFGWEIPIAWFNSINAFFVIVFAPVMAAVWTWWSKRPGGDLSSPAKFVLGLALAGIGFALMVLPANAIVASGGILKVSGWWLVFCYLFHSIGELCVSPVGLSSMTKLAPRRYLGQMMGIWFLATALGNLIAGLVGGNVNPENLPETPKLFLMTTVFCFGAAALLGLLVGPIRRMMQDK
jgi:POT family proton-dependent oligopeptide transporter